MMLNIELAIHSMMIYILGKKKQEPLVTFVNKKLKECELSPTILPLSLILMLPNTSSLL